MKIEGTMFELAKLLDLLECPEKNCGQTDCWDCVCKYNNIKIERIIKSE